MNEDQIIAKFLGEWWGEYWKFPNVKLAKEAEKQLQRIGNYKRRGETIEPLDVG